MLKVEDYGRIRRAHRDGMGIREIARSFGHSRRKIREALKAAEPQPYTLSRPRPRRVLTEVHQQWIDAVLAADEQAPPKQRHLATQLFRRLRDEEGYLGSYDQVRRYVAARRGRRRETFLPLSYEPGQRAESDFGHIWVDFPDQPRRPADGPAPTVLRTGRASARSAALPGHARREAGLPRSHRRLPQLASAGGVYPVARAF